MRACEGGPLLIMIRFLMHFVMVVCMILSSGHGLSLNHCLEKSIQQLTSSRSCFTLGQPDGLFLRVTSRSRASESFSQKPVPRNFVEQRCEGWYTIR